MPAVYGLFAAREWGRDPEKVKFTFVYLSPETVKREERNCRGYSGESPKKGSYYPKANTLPAKTKIVFFFLRKLLRAYKNAI